MAVWTRINTGAVSSGSGGSTVVTAAASINANDILLIWIAPRAGIGITGSYNTPAGWTSIATNGADAGSAGGTLFGKVAAGGETNVTVTDTHSINSMGRMLHYTGGSLTLSTAAVKNFDTLTQDIVIPAITPANDSTLTLYLANRGWNHSPTVSSWPNSATELCAAASAFGSNEMSLFIGEIIQTTATALSSGSVDIIDTNDASQQSMAVSLKVGSVASLFPKRRFNQTYLSM